MEEKEQVYAMLSKSLDVIGKMSDTQSTQAKYDKEMKLIDAKYRFKRFIAMLIFVFVLVLSCWSVFYINYFNSATKIEKHYISSNTNTNINRNINSNTEIESKLYGEE